MSQKLSEDEEGSEIEMEEGIQEEEDDLKPPKSTFIRVWDTVKDFVIAFVIVVIIIAAIFIYTGNWPPVVVIESSSMQHSNDTSFLGVIDTGDMVLVKSIESSSDITSYMKGKRTGYETYSEYGDVLIYEKNGYSDITPVIHRALIWVEFNTTTGNSYDLPELEHHKDGWTVQNGPQRWYNLTGTVILHKIGYDDREVLINLGTILNTFFSNSLTPHSGFLTLGDHNRGNIDQHTLTDEHNIRGELVGGFGGLRVRPIKAQWVIGVARGELPWFGLIKLYFQDSEITQRAPANSFTMLWVSIILIFAIPISIDIVIILWERKKEKEEVKKEEEDEFALEEEGSGEDGPPPPGQSEG
jgi:signal peptidase